MPKNNSDKTKAACQGKTELFSIRMAPSVKQNLQEKSKKLGISMTEYVNSAIQNAEIRVFDGKMIAAEIQNLCNLIYSKEASETIITKADEIITLLHRFLSELNHTANDSESCVIDSDAVIENEMVADSVDIDNEIDDEFEGWGDEE